MVGVMLTEPPTIALLGIGNAIMSCSCDTHVCVHAKTSVTLPDHFNGLWAHPLSAHQGFPLQTVLALLLNAQVCTVFHASGSSRSPVAESRVCQPMCLFQVLPFGVHSRDNGLSRCFFRSTSKTHKRAGHHYCFNSSAIYDFINFLAPFCIVLLGLW